MQTTPTTPAPQRRVSFAEYNAARQAIAKTLAWLEVDGLEFDIDPADAHLVQIVRNAYGQGAL